MRNLIFSVLFLLSAVLAGPARVAAEEPVPSRQLTGIFPPDPPDAWRIVTQVGGTSDCIGDLVSPMCAVDTLFACLERHDDSLCAIAEDKPIETFYPLAKKNRLDDPFYWRYRIIRVIRGDRIIGQKPPRGEPPPRSVVIMTSEEHCNSRFDDSCSPQEGERYFTVVRKAGKWIVIDVDRSEPIWN